MIETRTIDGEGGVALHAVAAGPEGAPALVLIHGWSQHHLVWKKQFEALSDRFRVVAFDLRGHGASEKPDEEAAYTRSEAWAGDVRAVMDAFSLEKPVLVGWSMGGWVLADYLRSFGDGDLAGVAEIGSGAVTGRFLPPEAVALRAPDVLAEGMFSEDHATNIAATIAFVRACFANPPAPDELATLVALNMYCPPKPRAWSRGRSEDYRATYQAVTKPAMIFHGERERVCVPPVFEGMTAALPKAEIALYPDAGHAPFWEAADAFNTDLANFVDRARTRTLEGCPT